MKIKILLSKISEIVFLAYVRTRRKFVWGIRFTNKDPEYRAYDVGDYTYGTPQIFNYGKTSNLKIGKFCSIARDVKFILGGVHNTKGATTYPLEEVFNVGNNKTFTKGDLIIGNDVWIGQGAMILSGITIGDGSIIGAGALVSKSVDPYSVVVGNPGQTIKRRFDQETIEKLLKMKWWDWDIKKIRKAIPLITGDIGGLINEYEK